MDTVWDVHGFPFQAQAKIHITVESFAALVMLLKQAGSSFAAQVVGDIQQLVQRKKSWIGCYEWQIDSLGNVVLIDGHNCGRRIICPLTLPDIVHVIEETTQEEPRPAIIMYVRLEPSVYMPDFDKTTSVSRVLNINNVDLDEHLRGRGFFSEFLSTLEAWLETEEEGATCNCLLVQNICNKRLLSHLARRTPAWRSPDAVHERMDMIRMRSTWVCSK